MDLPSLPSPTELAIPGFIAFMLLELFVRWLRHRSGGQEHGDAGIAYQTRDTLASLSMGAGNVVEGILVGFVSYGVLLFFWQYRVLDLGFGLGVFVVAYVLDDLRYYWYHRVAHESRWFWAAHVTHHSSQHYNLSTALRQTWTSTLSLAFVFSIPLALLGFHPLILGFVSALNAVYQFWIHTEAIRRLPWPIEAVFNTPSHHRVHHARNARYLDANYAGTLIIWDRLFGSFVPEDDAEPCRYGLTKNLGSFNPIRIAFHEWVAMLGDVARPGLTLGDRLRYLFGPPGWSHDGSRQTAKMLKEAWVAKHPEQAALPGLPALPPAGAPRHA